MNVSEVIYMYPLESQLIKAGIIFRGAGNDLKPGIMKCIIPCQQVLIEIGVSPAVIYYRILVFRIDISSIIRALDVTGFVIPHIIGNRGTKANA